MDRSRVWGFAQNLIFVLVLGSALSVAGLYFGLRLSGIALYTVESPSMRPGLSPGDVVGIQHVDPWDIKVGDIVAYSKDGVPVIHRVADVRWVGYDVVTKLKKADGSEESTVTARQPREFVFRGDNNPADDSEVVLQNQIIGRMALEVPPPFSWAATMLSRGTLVFLGVSSIVAYVIWELADAAVDLRRRRVAVV